MLRPLGRTKIAMVTSVVGESSQSKSQITTHAIAATSKRLTAVLLSMLEFLVVTFD